MRGAWQAGREVVAVISVRRDSSDCVMGRAGDNDGDGKVGVNPAWCRSFVVFWGCDCWAEISRGVIIVVSDKGSIWPWKSRLLAMAKCLNQEPVGLIRGLNDPESVLLSKRCAEEIKYHLLLRFQELAVIMPKHLVPNAEKLMEVFINGLPRSIEGNVTASKPQTLEEAINITQRLMDQIIKHDYVQEANDSKRSLRIKDAPKAHSIDIMRIECSKANNRATGKNLRDGLERLLGIGWWESSFLFQRGVVWLRDVCCGEIEVLDSMEWLKNVEFG
ncbi:hypothetical protein Tco_0895550 [Tanacetum coccineum]|uniref:Reverse transcriptase domain-containing protein n=1 Tax=Tanacetum coccineum TaxID=301880 RepID=A0ABQ5CG46_9ASTR